MKAKQPTSFIGVAGKVRKGPKSARGLIKMVLATLVVTALVFGAWRVYDKHRNDEIIKNLGGVKPTGKITTAKEEEKSNKDALNKTLKSGNYESYQVVKLGIVNGYIVQKDYKNAQRVLDEIKKGVPADKLLPAYYLRSLYLHQQANDKETQVQDYEDLITLYKHNNRSAEAAYYQQQLDILNGKKVTQPAPTSQTNESLN